MAAGYGLVPYGEGDWGSESSYVPGSGSLSAQSDAPSVNTGIIPTGGAAIIGSAPVVAVIERVKTPGSGAVGIASEAPTSQLAFAITTGAPQALSITGAAPTVLPATSTLITPASGSLTFDHGWGLGAWGGDGGWNADNPKPLLVFGTVIIPVTGSLAVEGAAPARIDGIGIAPDTGALDVAGVVPDLITDFRLTPAANDAVIAGQTPAIYISSVQQTFTGAVAIASDPPLSVVGDLAQPGVGSLSLSGSAPQTNTTYTPSTGAINAQGYAPSLVREEVVTPTGGAVLVGSAPVVVVRESVKVIPTRPVGITGIRPTIATGRFVTPTTGSVTLVGRSPEIKNPNWQPVNDTQDADWVPVAA